MLPAKPTHYFSSFVFNNNKCLLLSVGHIDESSSESSDSETDSEAIEDPVLLKRRLAEESTYELINMEIPELEGIWTPPLEARIMKEEEEGVVSFSIYK